MSDNDFDSLRIYFSPDDVGAQELTRDEFCRLNRSDAEGLIRKVENFRTRSRLQWIYDQAHPTDAENQREVKRLKFELEEKNEQLADANSALAASELIQISTSGILRATEQRKIIIDPEEFFEFATDLNLPDDILIEKIYTKWRSEGVAKPDDGAPEVTRNDKGTPHYYFWQMLLTIMEELGKESEFSRSIADQILGYECTLLPTRHIPDFHFRWKNDFFASILSAHLMFEIKPRKRPSKSVEEMRKECLADTISYGSSRYSELVKDLKSRGMWESTKIKNEIVVHSLGATPDELVAVRISLPRPCRSAEIDRVKDMDLMVCRTDFLRIDGEGNRPGPGFSLLVQAIAAGPRALALGATAVEPKTEWTHSGGTISLEARLGVGASSETYQIVHDRERWVLKIAKHADCFPLIEREANVLRRLNGGLSLDFPYIPRLCAEYEGGIATSPVGVPLTHVQGELWASQSGEERMKLSMVQGRLTLAFFVLESVSRAITFAMERGISHADIRMSNIIVTDSHCVLIDWGHSGDLGSPPPQGLGAPLFTPSDFAKNPVLSPAVDFCGLAGVVWQLLKAPPGKLPWQLEEEKRINDFPSFKAYLKQKIDERDDLAEELLDLLMRADGGSLYGCWEGLRERAKTDAKDLKVRVGNKDVFRFLWQAYQIE